METNLIVSSSPHMRSGASTQKIMLDVIIALTPAAIASCVIFGWSALLLIVLCVATCVLSEFICRKVMKRENTISDLSAVVTGILLAFNLPPTIHPLIAVFGGVVAIVVVKQMFGGIGQNFVNPALTARIILMSSFPSKMSTWASPFYYLGSSDAMTTATPLEPVGAGADGPASRATWICLLGVRAGCLGETCAVALLVLARRLSGGPKGHQSSDSGVLPGNGGTDLVGGGARCICWICFPAACCWAPFSWRRTMSPAPINFKGRIVFAVGCGVITMLIRMFGALPEGVSFSIVLMNILVPHD